MDSVVPARELTWIFFGQIRSPAQSESLESFRCRLQLTIDPLQIRPFAYDFVEVFW
jgi:hypothetical protein